MALMPAENDSPDVHPDAPRARKTRSGRRKTHRRRPSKPKIKLAKPKTPIDEDAIEAARDHDNAKCELIKLITAVRQSEPEPEGDALEPTAPAADLALSSANCSESCNNSQITMHITKSNYIPQEQRLISQHPNVFRKSRARFIKVAMHFTKVALNLSES